MIEYTILQVLGRSPSLALLSLKQLSVSFQVRH